MNFFEYFSIPESYHIDKKLLKEKYLAKTWELHPDINTSENVSEDSSFNNNAFKTLNKDLSRLAYLLQLHQVDEKKQLSMEFLSEMMDLNEKISDLEANFDDFEYEKTKNEIDIFEIDIFNQINSAAEKWETTDIEIDKENHLKILAEAYFELKYLLRLKDRMNTFAPLL